MALPKTLQNFTAFIDGVGWVGLIEEGSPPKITIKTEEYEGGGMAAPVDIDMGSVEKLECEMTFAEFNPTIYGHFGKQDLPLTIRGAISQSTEAEEVIFSMRGMVREIDPGTFKKGDKGALKIMATLTYVKITVAGTEVIEIDAVNMIRKVNGEDQLASQRQALGL